MSLVELRGHSTDPFEDFGWQPTEHFILASLVTLLQETDAD